MRDFKLQKDYEKQIVKIYFDKITTLPRYRFYQSVGHSDNLTTLEHESNSSGDGGVGDAVIGYFNIVYFITRNIMI